MKIAAFPKCYMDDICLHKTMTVFDWIEKSGALGAEGLEMYSGFFTSLDDSYLAMESGASVKSVLRIGTSPTGSFAR